MNPLTFYAMLQLCCAPSVNGTIRMSLCSARIATAAIATTPLPTAATHLQCVQCVQRGMHQVAVSVALPNPRDCANGAPKRLPAGLALTGVSSRLMCMKQKSLMARSECTAACKSVIRA